MGFYKTNAAAGNHFVLTQKGYDATPDHVKRERAVGKPVPSFAESVFTSWVKKGWVVEVRKEN